MAQLGTEPWHSGGGQWGWGRGKQRLATTSAIEEQSKVLIEIKIKWMQGDILL